MNVSEVTYWEWLGEDQHSELICTVASLKVPQVGEVIHINTQGNEDWYRANFPNDPEMRFFNKGVRGTFIVRSIERYIKSYDIVVKETDLGNKFEFPGKKIVENFEVHLERVEQ